VTVDAAFCNGQHQLLTFQLLPCTVSGKSRFANSPTHLDPAVLLQHPPSTAGCPSASSPSSSSSPSSPCRLKPREYKHTATQQAGIEFDVNEQSPHPVAAAAATGNTGSRNDHKQAASTSSPGPRVQSVFLTGLRLLPAPPLPGTSSANTSLARRPGGRRGAAALAVGEQGRGKAAGRRSRNIQVRGNKWCTADWATAAAHGLPAAPSACTGRFLTTLHTPAQNQRI